MSFSGFLGLCYLVICATCTAKTVKPADLYLHYADGSSWEIAINFTARNCNGPDSMAIAFHSNVTGLTSLLAAAGTTTYANIGPDLNHTTPNCESFVFNATQDPAPQSYANFQWLQSVHVLPNGTMIGLVHNEMHGYTPSERKLGYCTMPSGNDYCNMWSTGLAVSHNGGKSFTVLGNPPSNRVFSDPYPYVKDTHNHGE